MRNIGHISRAVGGLVLLGSFVICVGSLPLTSQAQEMEVKGGTLKIQQKILFEKLAELPSRNVNVKVRHVTMPVGFKTPVHTHKGPGPRYILKGKLEIIEGGLTGTYGAGEVFWESGIPMTAENVGGEQAQLIIFELLPVK